MYIKVARQIGSLKSTTQLQKSFHKNKRKRKQKKQNRFVTYHKISYTKPTWKTYVPHKRQGQFVGFHFLIALFKEATKFTFLISTGTNSQVLGARWDNVSEPKITDFIGLE